MVSSRVEPCRAGGEHCDSATAEPRSLLPEASPLETGSSFSWGRIRRGERVAGTDGTSCPFSLELFSAPVLTESPSPSPDRGLVTLSCETKLLGPGPGPRLYFSFYAGSEVLQDRNTSSRLHLRSKRGDSRLYSCEVTTEDGSVRKRSPELPRLGRQSSAPVLFRILFCLSVGIMFLVNTVLYVKIHKKLQGKKKCSLKVPLVSDQGKKETFFPQVGGDDISEEVRANVKWTTPKEAPEEPVSGHPWTSTA